MASSPDFVNYICEQLEGTGAVRFRKMFGEYMVYLNDKPVLLVCDNTPFAKPHPCLAQLLKDRPMALPYEGYEGTKEHYVLDPDDGETLRQAALLLEAVTPLPKKKVRGAKKTPKPRGNGPVPWHIAWPAHSKPELADIAAWVGSPLFGQLTGWVGDTYGSAPSIEFSVCTLDPGWNVKYKKGAKALCTLYPRAGFVTCMVSVGGKLLPDVETMLPTFTPEFQAIYEKTSLFNGGKWLILDLKDPAQLEDVQRLMLMKVKPPRKKA